MGKLLSMTGYGSAKGSVEGQEITVELKSVNNRYLDCSVRLPRNFLFAEDTVKQAVSAGVSRGKVDVFVSAQASQDSGTVVSVNEELARGYRDAVAHIAETLGLESGLNAFSLARFPDVLTVERRELDKDKAAAALSEITAKAVEEFNAMREHEGERLRRDMLGKLETIEGLVSVVEERSPQTVKEYRERLEARLRDILAARSMSSVSSPKPRSSPTAPPWTRRRSGSAATLRSSAPCWRKALRSAGRWTSLCRNSTANPTPSAPSAATHLSPRSWSISNPRSRRSASSCRTWNEVRI